MGKTIKIIMLLVAGLLVVTNVSAYTAVGSVVKLGDGSGADAGETYLGYMGNVQNGWPTWLVGDPNWIGTNLLYDNGYVLNYPELLTSTTVQWYSFDSSGASPISAFYEFGRSLESFTISFYLDGDSDNTLLYSREFNAADMQGVNSSWHLYAYGFSDFLNEGKYLMKIEGLSADDIDMGYKVRLFAAVPLPPAALLFVSALAGFGVVGRKKRHSA